MIMIREEHLDWAKKRAIEYAERGDTLGAYNSMSSDLNKHPETQGHSAIGLGMMLLASGNLNSKDKMIEFINGFN